MNAQTREAVHKLLGACSEVQLAEKRAAENARLRRSVQNLMAAARAVQELMDQEKPSDKD